jgi:nucleoside-diphosphate-sugar epimerase
MSSSSSLYSYKPVTNTIQGPQGPQGRQGMIGFTGVTGPVGPRGVYDEAKRFQEAMTMAYHTFHNVETRIIRIFNTFKTTS